MGPQGRRDHQWPSLVWRMAGRLSSSVEGQGRLPLQFTSPAAPLCQGEAFLILSWATGRPQSHRMNAATLSPGKPSKQGHIWRHTKKELQESAQKLQWPRSDTRCHLQVGHQESRQCSTRDSEYLCRQSEGLSQEYYVCHCPTTSQEAFGGSALPS